MLIPPPSVSVFEAALSRQVIRNEVRLFRREADGLADLMISSEREAMAPGYFIQLAKEAAALVLLLVEVHGQPW
jgi:hypothetical protein